MRGGIDLGGTKIQAVIVDSDHEVRGETRVPTPTSGGPSDVAAAMAGALGEAAKAAGVQTAELDGVGVGSPGDVDGEKGTVTSARNLPDWEGSFPLADELSKALGTRVALGNDVQVATDAEALLGAGRPYRSLLGVFWGTGVGGGIVLDGRPWLGRGAAGEIGHVVVKRDGARCTCGRKGCMEAYAGRASMEIRARAKQKSGTQDRPLRDHEGARPRPAHERHLGPRAGPRRQAGRGAHGRRHRGARARASPRCRTCSTSTRSSSAAAWASASASPTPSASSTR